MTRTTISNFVFFTIAALCLMWGISGCEEKVPPPPPPKIEVESHDTTEWSGITVKYYHHQYGRNGYPAIVILNSPEEVLQYKKQVEFLLKQLEDAERKMAIKADE